MAPQSKAVAPHFCLVGTQPAGRSSAASRLSGAFGMTTKRLYDQIFGSITAPLVESSGHAGGRLATHDQKCLAWEAVGARTLPGRFPKMCAEVWVASSVTSKGPPAVPSKVTESCSETIIARRPKADEPSTALIAASGPANSMLSSANEGLGGAIVASASHFVQREQQPPPCGSYACLAGCPCSSGASRLGPPLGSLQFVPPEA